jgi:hypothetical protein
MVRVENKMRSVGTTAHDIIYVNRILISYTNCNKNIFSEKLQRQTDWHCLINLSEQNVDSEAMRKKSPKISASFGRLRVVL